VTTPPTFASIQEYVSRLGDDGFWWPRIAEILERHGLADAGREPLAGFNATYPTFIVGDVVVKLFGYVRSWRESHSAERDAHALFATDSQINAPRLLGEGRLYDHADSPWPYLITARMSGVASWRAELSTEQRFVVAEELGRQVRRVHALRPSGVATDANWPALHVKAAAKQSSLSPHLIAQIDDYLARLFRCFLEACEWPAGRDFAAKTLGLALYRQATGLAQHLTFDIFHPLPAEISLEEIDTLDELATELFAV